MDHVLVNLSPSELDAIAAFDSDGSLRVATGELSRVISRAMGIVGVRVGVSNAD